MTIYFGNAPGRQSTNLNSGLVFDCENRNNALFQADRDRQLLNWVTIPVIQQATRTQSIKFLTLPVASVQVLPKNQESLASNQDLSINTNFAIKSVAKSTENVLTRLIDSLSKNPEFKLDFALVCTRIGLEWKLHTHLKL